MECAVRIFGGGERGEEDYFVPAKLVDARACIRDIRSHARARVDVLILDRPRMLHFRETRPVVVGARRMNDGIRVGFIA